MMPGDASTLQVKRSSKGVNGAGDVFMSRVVLTGLICRLFGKKEDLIRDAERDYEMMRRELRGADSSPLEDLAIERILICHAALHRLETLIYVLDRQMTIDDMNAYEKRVCRLQSRYLEAVRCLAQIRKLRLPNMQINIGEKQVNIGSPQVSFGQTTEG